MGPGHPITEHCIIMALCADRVFSPISLPPRPQIRTRVPDHVLYGPARARPCPRPLTFANQPSAQGYVRGQQQHIVEQHIEHDPAASAPFRMYNVSWA